MATWIIVLAAWIAVDVAIVVGLARMSGARSVASILGARRRDLSSAPLGEVRADGAQLRSEPVPRLRIVSSR